jgi:hypothetical protein
MLTIDQLFRGLSPAEVKSTLYQLAESFGLSTTAWQKLSPLRAIFAVLAQLVSNVTVLQATVNQSAFLDDATGELLQNLARYVYGVAPREATFARGEVTVNNGAGGLYTYGPGDLVVTSSALKKAYRNLAPVTIHPNELGVVVPIEALEQGSASTAAPGQIDGFATGAPGLSVANAHAVVGEDEESAADLRQRCRAKLGALSPSGPSTAYAYVATTRENNGGVPCDRVLVRPAEGNGTIRVVVAGPDGAIAGTTGDPATDLGKLFLALNRLAVPAGYTLLLSSASVVTVTPSATIYVAQSAGLTDAQAIAAVEQAVANYLPTLPIGGVDLGGGGAVLFRALEAVMSAAARGILEVKLSSELDIAIGATEVAVLGSPVFAVTQVAA